MDRGSNNNKSGSGRSSHRGGRVTSRNDTHRNSSYHPGGGRGEIRRRSRSKDGDSRNGWINDKHIDKRSVNNLRRVEPTSSRSKDKPRDYNKDHYRSSTDKHHNNSITCRKSREGTDKIVVDERRRSLPSVQSPRKTKPLTVRRRSSSRNRHPIRTSDSTRDIGSRNHQHHHHHHRRIFPLPHQHHHHHHHHHTNHTNKPSALDNRDTSKKRDNSRRSRSISDTRRRSSSRKDMTRHSSARRPSSTSAAPTSTTSSSAAEAKKDGKICKDNASSSTTTTNGVFNHKRSPQASSSKHKDCKDSNLSMSLPSTSPKKRRRSDGLRGKDDDKKKFSNNNSLNHRKRPLHHHPMSISKRSRSLNSAMPPSKCSSSRIAARRKQRALSSLSKPISGNSTGKGRPLGGGGAQPSKRLHSKKPCTEHRLENNSQTGGSSSCITSLPTNSSSSPSRMQSSSTVGNSSAVQKVTLDDLSGNNNTADEYDELSQVEKWVRSAPDELYYSRQSEG